MWTRLTLASPFLLLALLLPSLTAAAPSAQNSDAIVKRAVVPAIATDSVDVSAAFGPPITASPRTDGGETAIGTSDAHGRLAFLVMGGAVQLNIQLEGKGVAGHAVTLATHGSDAFVYVATQDGSPLGLGAANLGQQPLSSEAHVENLVAPLAILAVIKIISVIDTVKSLWDLAIDPPELVQVTLAGAEFCASPEQLSKIGALASGLFIGNIGKLSGKTIWAQITGEATKIFAGKLVELGIAKSLSAPVRYRLRPSLLPTLGFPPVVEILKEPCPGPSIVKTGLWQKDQSRTDTSICDITKPIPPNSPNSAVCLTYSVQNLPAGSHDWVITWHWTEAGQTHEQKFTVKRTYAKDDPANIHTSFSWHPMGPPPTRVWLTVSIDGIDAGSIELLGP